MTVPTRLDQSHRVAGIVADDVRQAVDRDRIRVRLRSNRTRAQVRRCGVVLHAFVRFRCWIRPFSPGVSRTLRRDDTKI